MGGKISEARGFQPHDRLDKRATLTTGIRIADRQIWCTSLNMIGLSSQASAPGPTFAVGNASGRITMGIFRAAEVLLHVWPHLCHWSARRLPAVVAISGAIKGGRCRNCGRDGPAVAEWGQGKHAPAQRTGGENWTALPGNSQ